MFSVNQRILFFFPRQKTFQYSCVYIFYVLVKLESMEDNDLDYTTMINLIQLLGADQAWEHGEEQEQEEGRPQQDVRYLGRRRGWWSTPTSISSPLLGHKISHGFSPKRFFWTYCTYHHNNHHTKTFEHHRRSKNSWQIQQTLIFNQNEINIFQTFISYKKWKSIFSRLWCWWGWHHLKGGIWKWHEWVSS